MRFLERAGLTLAMLMIATAAFGAGFAVWEMGTRSSGMGGVMAATADDPSAIFFNPAGLVGQEGQQLGVYLTNVIPRTEFSGIAPNPGYGVTERLDDPIFFLPQLYYTRTINENLAAGIGFCTPYGLAVEWKNPDTFTGRGIATLTDLKTYFFIPTIAYRLNDRVRVGLGLNIVLGEVTLNQRLFSEMPNPAEAGKVVVEGDANIAVGVNLGLLVDLNEDTRFGFSYKSGINHEFEGEVEFIEMIDNVQLPSNGDASTEVPLPAMYTIGLAREFTDKLMMEINVMRIEWSAFEELKLVFPDTTKVIEENYENTIQFRFGLEYAYKPELTLRTGFVYDESPQPMGSTGPVLPDSDRTGFSVGGTWTHGNIDLEFYNLCLFFKDREVRENYEGFNGDYHTYTNLCGLGFTYHF
ncbi:MAG: hypothetical protein GY835_21990 [bacterium]|nr:hypothetical protein [bacterium]